MTALGNKEIMSDNIVRLMKIKNVTRNQMSDELNVSYTTLTDWINGNTYPRIDKIELMSNYFGVSKSELVEPHLADDVANKISATVTKLNTDRKNNVYQYAVNQLDEQNNVVAFPTKQKQQVSVYGAVSAGTGEYLLDGTPELVDYDGEVPMHDFAVVVNGDSMLPLFDDKQIIFVKKTTEVRSGQIVIADYDQQAFVKKYVSDESGSRFVSLNKKYDDMPIDENHETSIFGVVVL